MRFTHALMLCLILPISLCPAQEAPVLLTGFESVEGLGLTYDARNPATELSLNTDPRFISEGEASLLLESVSPEGATGNTYLGVMVQLDEPVSFARRAMLFDAWTTEPDNTRALYVRGYDPEGKVALSWQSWSSPVRSDEKHEIELIPALSLPGMAWEQSVAVSERRDEIVRLEFIIGTNQRGAPYNIYLDNVRLVPSEVTSFMDTEQVKPLHLETSLLEEGRPAAVILRPDGDEWAPVAADLQAALRERLGADFPVRAAADMTDDDLRETTIIALGNVVNNRRLLYLYAHMYTYADDLYPGPDGYIVQSIHDPWGTGRNVLLVGASTPAGAEAGVVALLEEIGEDGAVPPVFQVELAGVARERFGGVLQQEPDEEYLARQREAAEDDLRRGAHGGLFSRMVTVGSQYLQTRKDGYAELFAWLARRAKEHHDSDPGTYGGPWGMDSDFRVHNVLPMWDNIEESPALSDEDRLEVARILFEWVSDVCPRKVAGAVGSERVRHNHQTFPALGLLFAGEYFSKYYHAAEGRRWLEICDGIFQFQVQAHKPHEDCNGYQWLTLYHTMQYSLARPDFTFFENGNARTCADFAILCMDNLAYPVTYGDCPPWSGWWSEMPFLRGALWYYGDPRYAWTLEKKERVSGRIGLGQYYMSAEQEGPADITGAIAWPLDPHYYRSWGGPERLEEQRAVDKVVFRTGFDPQGQYLLLDGLSNGGHGHMDGNSLSRWTENGRIWLADSDYILSLPKYHSGVLIFRDGQSARIPPFVELERIVDLPSFGASTTTYREYAGVDWRRHILWLKDNVFLVADEMVARQDGDYSFRVVWNTVGEVKLTEAGMSIEQDGQHAAIAVSPDLRLSLADDPDYGKNWATYRFIREPVVRVFQGIRDATLREGESVVLFSVLHASGEEPSPVRLLQIDDNAVVVDGLAEPVQVVVGQAQWQLRQGTAPGAADERTVFRAVGEACLITPQKVFVVGATESAGLGEAPAEDVAVDLEYDLIEGRGVRVEPSRTAARAEAQTVQVAGNSIEAGDMRAALEGALARALPVQRPTAAAVEVPRELPVRWSYREKLDSYLLTNNVGAFEAVDTGLTFSAAPDPLPANVFSGQEGENTPDGLFDGQLLTTGGGVMWDDDQPVTINLEFDSDYDLDKLTLRQWFATSSSRQKLFQLGSLIVEASGDGFVDDVRTVIEFTDEEAHGNWGAPGYGPQTYELNLPDVTARALRLHLMPRPGTAVYIAELEVWGNREGLEIDYETLKERAVPVHVFQAVTLADLTGDGVAEVIAGSTNGKVYALTAEGETLWSVETGGAVNSVAAVDFAGDGNLAVVAGSMGATATAVSAQGEVMWTFSVPYYKRVGHVRTVFGADLTGDGKQVAVIGADNWHYYALDADGKELWRYESVHGSTVGTAADLTGDGNQEVVAGTEYYWWHAVRPDGRRLFQYNTRGGPHAKSVATANLDGDGTHVVVFGGADGNVHVVNADGQLRWLFNTGDEVLAVAAADITGDGRDEIIAGSMSFNVYALDAQGEMLWRRDLGSEVRRLAVLPTPAGPALLAACGDGALYLLNARDGAVVAGRRFAAPLLALAAAESGIAVIAAEDGDLTALGVAW